MRTCERLAAYDRDLRQQYAGEILVGVDECGRGAYAGPFVAAACALGADTLLPHLNDSKKMSAKRREELYVLIQERALAYAVVCIEPEYIDAQGLTAANIKAMESAAEAVKAQLSERSIALYVVDQAPKFSHKPLLMLPRADGTSQCVAAASVLAKVHRDRLMVDLARLHPEYGWEDNKGYISPYHREAVIAHGLTKHHRKSYQVAGYNAPRQTSLLDL